MTLFDTDPAITLLPEGAVFLTTTRTLVVADIHLGKSAAFRAKGLPIPEGDNARDFQRLLELVRKWRPERVVIAGDLFHAPSGIDEDLERTLAGFLAEIAIPLTLVVGNHDLKIRRLPAGFESAPHLDLGENLRIVHDPAHASGDTIHICGHWHPVVRIPDGKRTSLRLPCFLYRNHTLVLPAFGSFTGGAILSPEADDRVFVTLREQVVELPPELIR
ncbi:MAG: ligase-associated DNA damage response endonuclease PdeM [Verrucomicrobiota bacterium]